MSSPAGELVDCGRAARASGFAAATDGTGNGGDPPALPGHEETHPGRHSGQEGPTTAGFLSSWQVRRWRQH